MDFWLNRDIQNSWIFQDAEKFKWWVDLLLMADEEGEVRMNLSDLYHRWKRPKPTILRFLEKLSAERIGGTKAERIGGTIRIYGIESYKGERNDRRNESGTHKESPLISLSPTPPIPFNPKEYYNTSTAHAHIRTQEDEFARRYKDEGLWMDVALILHVKSLEKCQSLFEDFVTECQHNSTGHRDYADFKRHFVQWARIALKKELDNGNYNRQDKHRGIQVVANSPEDYKGPF